MTMANSPPDDGDDPCCPKCGSDDGEWEQCCSCHGDGCFDLHDDDPVNFGPDEEFEACEECRGAGGCWVCHGCAKAAKAE